MLQVLVVCRSSASILWQTKTTGSALVHCGFQLIGCLTNRSAVEEPPGIFGVPLAVSIKYANVAISLTNEEGQSFIYGYVPIVVAKCGVYLKEKGMAALTIARRI